jgi:hypothetical protein
VGVTGLLFGVYFGLLQQSKSFDGMTNYVQPKTKTVLKIITRVVVTVVLIIPIMLMSLLSPDQIQNLYVLMLLKNLIPLTVVGYLLFGIADQVCAMFGLLDKKG